MKKTPDLYDLVRADQVRAAQKAPRKGNNPWMTTETYPSATYRDPTADEAIGRVDRERRKNKTPR